MGYITRYRASTRDFNTILAYYKEHEYLKVCEKENEFGHLIANKDTSPAYCYFAKGRILYARDCVIRTLIDVERESKYDYNSLTKMDIVYLESSLDKTILDMTGRDAYINMTQILKNFYTKKEIDERLKMFESEEDERKSQYHYYYHDTKDKIYKFNNCRYYDINSAHGDALREIFPRAAAKIEEIYAERKIKPENKKLLNYYVGYLCCVGHRKTYNWIVQRTSSILKDAIEKTITIDQGTIIYVNTDGFMVSNPASELETGKEIGKFKLEYSGDIYVYRHPSMDSTPYFSVQYGDEIKGNALIESRCGMNLRDGVIPEYKRIKVDAGYIADDIELTIKEIEEHE